MVKMIPLVLIRVPMILSLKASQSGVPEHLSLKSLKHKRTLSSAFLIGQEDKKGSLITNINDLKRAPHVCGRVW